MLSGAVRIRDAVRADLAVLRLVFRRSSLSNDDDRANLLEHPETLELSDLGVREGRTRVAICNERVVGFATTLGGGTAAEVEDLFVDPDFMRRGIGRALVLDMVAIARTRGIHRLDVVANPHALAFYSSAGFVDDGVIETRFGPAPRMRLDITG
jgi:ribosomal protein S18 acetylase RimI-like enzyme